MTKYFFITIIGWLFIFFTPQVFAESTSVTVSVGKYNFSVSGFVSPFASIVLKSSSIFMASTVADPKGNFSIKNVLINEGFSDFCLEAIDVKKIGDSLTCFKIPAATGNTEKKDIFLPPTMGLSGKKINPGSSIFASGYSMPNAKVIINISKDIVLNTSADESGFYKLEIKDLPVGKYSLFATARYENKDSEKPTKKLELESLSLSQVIKQNLLKIIILVLVVLVIFILIFILFGRKLRGRIKAFLSKRKFWKKKKFAKLHHDWFLVE